MKKSAWLGLAVAMLAASCSDSDTTTGAGGAGGGATEPAWQVVFDDEDLDKAVVSVWGSGPSDVFVVGGGLGNTPFGALALRFDGTGWTDLEPGGDDSFWWVTGSGVNDVWMVGENGRIAHYDGVAFAAHDFTTTATLWGAWAFAENDAWVVGGTPLGGVAEDNDIILHWDGSSFTEVTLPEQLGVALYKVWGVSSDDLYVVGEDGTIWHKIGADWFNESGVASSTLFTVYGCSATEVYAVGSFDVLVTSGDGSWEPVDVDLSNAVNGVSCAAPGAPIIAGAGGLKQRLVEGTWIDEFTEPPYDDLHATWAQGDGVFWVVGGDFQSSATPNAPRAGVVARYGETTIADAL